MLLTGDQLDYTAHRQFVKIIGDNVGWEMYKTDIIQRFRSVFEDPMADLKIAKYKKSAKEYQDMFDTLLCRVEISQEHAATLEAVKKKNKSFLPSNGGRSRNEISYGGNLKSPLLALPAPNTSWKLKPNTLVNAPVRKQLSQKEYQEKRAQNLCFYCDQNYTPWHKCSEQLYSLVILPNEEEEFFEVEQGEEEEIP
ncbi:hypothetical protein Tco_0608665 [Tanacetum coccineum]